MARSRSTTSTAEGRLRGLVARQLRSGGGASGRAERGAASSVRRGGAAAQLSRGSRAAGPGGQQARQPCGCEHTRRSGRQCCHGSIARFPSRPSSASGAHSRMSSRTSGGHSTGTLRQHRTMDVQPAHHGSTAGEGRSTWQRTARCCPGLHAGKGSRSRSACAASCCACCAHLTSRSWPRIGVAPVQISHSTTPAGSKPAGVAYGAAHAVLGKRLLRHAMVPPAAWVSKRRGITC